VVRKKFQLSVITLKEIKKLQEIRRTVREKVPGFFTTVKMELYGKICLKPTKT